MELLRNFRASRLIATNHLAGQPSQQAEQGIDYATESLNQLAGLDEESR
jgi:hypothetical protein